MLRKTIRLMGICCLGIATLQAQTGRVGINTENPQATLDIKEVAINELPKGTSQGLSLPNLSSDDRSTFTSVKVGTMIYNTTKNCLEVYTYVNGDLGWYCIGMANVPPVSITPTVVREIRTKFNIPYTGKATGSYSEQRIEKNTHIISSVDNNVQYPIKLTLVIPSGSFTGNDGGNISAIFEVEGDLPKHYDEVSWDFPIKINGVASNVTLRLVSTLFEITNSKFNFPDGYKIINGSPIVYTYQGRAIGSYPEIIHTIPSSRLETGRDGKQENVRIRIPAGNFSGNPSGEIRGYFEVDGDGTYEMPCNMMDLGSGNIYIHATVAGTRQESYLNIDYNPPKCY